MVMTCGSGRAAVPADAKTLGQVDFDEVAVLAAQLAEGIQSLDDAGATRPPRAHASRKRNNGDAPRGKGLETSGAVTIIH